MRDARPILFVDDEEPMRQAVTQWLELEASSLAYDSRAGHRCADGRFSRRARDRSQNGEMDGLELFRRTQQIDPELPVVMITGHGDVQTAVEAMQRRL